MDRSQHVDDYAAKSKSKHESECELELSHDAAAITAVAVADAATLDADVAIAITIVDATVALVGTVLASKTINAIADGTCLATTNDGSAAKTTSNSTTAGLDASYAGAVSAVDYVVLAVAIVVATAVPAK